MNKQEMIEYVKVWYGSWELFYKAIRLLNEIKIHGWLVCYEGQDIGDMILCSKNPHGDDLGEVITCMDCFS